MYPKISARKAPRRALGSGGTFLRKARNRRTLLASIMARKLGAYADQYIEMVIGIRVPLPAGISAHGTYPSVSKWIIKRKLCPLFL
jgi:hypothetical protein